MSFLTDVSSGTPFPDRAMRKVSYCRNTGLASKGVPFGRPQNVNFEAFLVLLRHSARTAGQNEMRHSDGHGCRWMSRARIAAVREAPSIAPGFQFSHAELFRSHRPRALELSFLFEACNFQGGLAKTVPPTFSATLLSRSTFCLDFGHRRFATYFWFSSKSPLST